jgi:tetratricopeptide (TPR) repeat protein
MPKTFALLLALALLLACDRAPEVHTPAPTPAEDTLGRQAAAQAMDLYRAGEVNEAVRMAEDLLGSPLDLVGPKARTAAWMVIGRVAQDESRFMDALEAYGQAREIARSAGDHQGESSALNQLGNVHLMRGDHEAALGHALENLRLKEQLGDTAGMARAHHNLSMMYFEQGDLDAAEKAQGISLAIKEQLGDSLGIHNALSVLCMLAIERNEPELAVAHMERALDIQLRNFPHLDIASTYVNLGLAHDKAGRPKEATRYYREALHELDERPNDAHRAVLLTNMGQLLMDQGSTAEAGPFLRESLELARRVGSRLEERSALAALLNHHKAEGRYRDALAVSEALMTLNDSLLNEEKVRSMNEMRVRYDTERGEVENERLTQANELAQARLERQHLIMLGFAVAAVLVLAMVVVLVRNWRRRMTRRMNELEHQALRAQMDPHFLFNALSSVPGLYYEHGPARVSDYVGHLGQLLRLILDSSATRLVHVGSEVDLITHYFRVMEFRHPGRFTWTIRVDPDIDTQRTGLPPMLLQPLVENALLHGAVERAEGGHVEVHISSAKDGLHCRVRDNGPGMMAPPDLTKGRPTGLRITEERIRLANGRRGTGLVFRTVSAPPGEEGTEVCFTVRSADLWS